MHACCLAIFGKLAIATRDETLRVLRHSREAGRNLLPAHSGAQEALRKLRTQYKGRSLSTSRQKLQEGERRASTTLRHAEVGSPGKSALGEASPASGLPVCLGAASPRCHHSPKTYNARPAVRDTLVRPPLSSVYEDLVSARPRMKINQMAHMCRLCRSNHSFVQPHDGGPDPE